MFFMQKSFLFRFFCLLFALGTISALLALSAQKAIPSSPLSSSVDSPAPAARTVVIDAGHGGEDGGAVSADGLCEKEINLKIASLLCDLLKKEGVNVVMTRTEDTLLYDKTVDYHGRKKALDLEARRQIVESVGSCILVSIHLNSFPLTQYKGLQVWYSQNDPESARLAETIRTTVRETLQPENTRACKPATSSIYLLHRTHVPAVLVECGFLSNPQEAAALATDDYQQRLAQTLARAILQYSEQSARG